VIAPSQSTSEPKSAKETSKAVPSAEKRKTRGKSTKKEEEEEPKQETEFSKFGFLYSKERSPFENYVTNYQSNFFYVRHTESIPYDE
jgi:hypothetical protein